MMGLKMAKEKVVVEFDADEELSKKIKRAEAKLRRKDTKIEILEAELAEAERIIKSYRGIDGALQELARVAGDVGLIDGEWYI